MAASASGPSAPNLGTYVFYEKLGQGTYATVYKATKKSGPREVFAIKCVEKKSLNKTSTRNLLQEIELLKNLQHEHIVQLKDFEWDRNYIYLIMEYCSGRDLSHFIHSKRKLPERMAKYFLQQLASALQYMRSKNVCHLDLKPQNILLSSSHNPVLKVADFGFSHILRGDKDKNTPFLVGSLLYMAPEIIHERRYNAKADLWSVGVILFECLYGRPPYSAPSLEEVVAKVKESPEIVIPTDVKVSEKCEDLLSRLLQKNPDCRIEFEEFFDHPFIDLDLKPSAKSLPKAISLVSEAVNKDTEGHYAEAIDLYCKALEHFMPAIHYERDVRKKEAIRKKVQEYMQRAEELKKLVTSRMKDARLSRQVSSLNDSHAVNGSESDYTEDFKKALRLAYAAQIQERKENYEEAQKGYEKAIESLLVLLKNERMTVRKGILQREVNKWMTRAEELKEFLKVQKLDTTDRSAADEEDQQRLMSSCTIQ